NHWRWPAGLLFFFFQAEDGIRDRNVTGVQTCALPICTARRFSATTGAWSRTADAVLPFGVPALSPRAKTSGKFGCCSVVASTFAQPPGCSGSARPLSAIQGAADWGGTTCSASRSEEHTSELQ